jgi:hypothetical protein
VKYWETWNILKALTVWLFDHMTFMLGFWCIWSLSEIFQLHVYHVLPVLMRGDLGQFTTTDQWNPLPHQIKKIIKSMHSHQMHNWYINFLGVRVPCCSSGYGNWFLTTYLTPLTWVHITWHKVSSHPTKVGEGVSLVSCCKLSKIPPH